MKSRKERRKEARESKIDFEPQYKGGKEPVRVQHPDVLKIQKNEERRKKDK